MSKSCYTSGIYPTSLEGTLIDSSERKTFPRGSVGLMDFILCIWGKCNVLVLSFTEKLRFLKK